MPLWFEPDDECQWTAFRVEFKDLPWRELCCATCLLARFHYTLDIVAILETVQQNPFTENDLR